MSASAKIQPDGEGNRIILENGEVRATYPHGLHVTARVERNLLVYKVDLAVPNAAPIRATWIAANGHVIRRVAAP